MRQAFGPLKGLFFGLFWRRKYPRIESLKFETLFFLSLHEHVYFLKKKLKSPFVRKINFYSQLEKEI